MPHHHTRHIILDMHDCTADATSLALAEQAVRTAAKAAKATVLHVSSHDFGEHQGVTALALLAESHISIHSWPETGYVAADIFTCGTCDCDAAARFLLDTYRPARHAVQHIKRG